MRNSITTRADSVRVVQLGSAGNPSTAVWPFPLQLLLKPAQRNNIIIKSAIATYIGFTYLETSQSDASNRHAFRPKPIRVL